MVYLEPPKESEQEERSTFFGQNKDKQTVFVSIKI
jgi:hypothetical protein